MQFSIEPYVGAGKIRLGMTSKQIEDVLSKKPEKFKKSEDDDYETDDFGMCFAYYKKPGVCEAIEFYEPADVMFRGVKMLKVPFDYAKQIFLSMDKKTECNESGLISYMYGIGLYAPFAEDEPNLPPEGVIVFEKNYYNN